MHRRRFIAATGTAGIALAMAPAIMCRAASAESAQDRQLPVRTVGTRTGYAALGWSDGSSRWMISRLSHTVPLGARNLQLVYGNFAPRGPQLEADGPNPITLSVAVEFPEGRPLPVKFAGRDAIRLLPGQMAICDPLDISIPPRGRCFTRTQVIADTPPYKWPLTRSASPPVGDWSITGSDPARISDAENLRHQEFKCFGPYNMLGSPQQPGGAVVILGDSVVCGEPGPGDQFGDRGYIERALSVDLPWCNLAVPGISVAQFLSQSAKQRAIIGHNFTHAISALGIADIRVGNQPLIMQHMHDLWIGLTNQGLAVFQSTITTHTNSPDHWTSVAGQTVANPHFLPGGIYHAINQWIRSTPPPLRGYFDPAAILETAVDSGIWRAPQHQALTLDGPHPDALGALMASKAISIRQLGS